MDQRAKLAFFLLFLFFVTQNVDAKEETNVRIHGNLGLSSPRDKNFDTGVWSGFGFSIPMKKIYIFPLILEHGRVKPAQNLEDFRREAYR